MKFADQLREKAAAAIAAARKIVEGCEAEGREMHDEERQAFARATDDATRLGEEAGRVEELEAAEERLEFARRQAEDRRRQAAERKVVPPAPKKPGESADAGDDLARTAFRKYLQGRDLSEAERFSVTTGGHGSYLLPKYISPKWVGTIASNNGLWESIDVQDSWEALTIGIPLITGFAEAQPVADNDSAAAVADTTFDIGEKVLTAVYNAIPIPVSLLQREFSNIDEILATEAAVAFANAYEKQMCVGTGTAQGTGIFVDTGITAYAGANTATAIDAATIKSARFQLKAGYARNARWLVSKEFLAKVYALKTASDGVYIFDSEKQTLDGIPYIVSEYVPTTFTAGEKVAAIGDFRNLKAIADPNPAVELVTDSTLAKKNQVLYVFRAKFNCKVAQPAAFRTIAMAAS